MEISLQGFHEDVATLACTTELAEGVPVAVTENGTVAAATANQPFCGITAGPSRDGYVAVQLTGYARATYSGTEPKVGYQSLSAGADGSICTTPSSGATGRTMLVLDVDTTAKTAGFLL